MLQFSIEDTAIHILNTYYLLADGSYLLPVI